MINKTLRYLGLAALVAGCATTDGKNYGPALQVPEEEQPWKEGIERTATGYQSIACFRGRNPAMAQLYRDTAAERAIRKVTLRFGKDVDVSGVQKDYQTIGDQICAKVDIPDSAIKVNQ